MFSSGERYYTTHIRKKHTVDGPFLNYGEQGRGLLLSDQRSKQIRRRLKHVVRHIVEWFFIRENRTEKPGITLGISCSGGHHFTTVTN
jgi:hypothetical protein